MTDHARFIDPKRRFELACAFAGSTQATQPLWRSPLVCVECGHGIGYPRRYIGEAHAPICMSCVDRSCQVRR